MDEVEGESLRQRLSREGRLPIAEVARIVADLAAALDAAGRAGVVHRDVKPENVLLEAAPAARCSPTSGSPARWWWTARSSTGQGVAVGTPSYMSPEQAAGEEVDSRSDLYGLGVVAYEMLAGHPPFQGTNRVVVSKHIAERPVADRAGPPRLPAAAGRRRHEGAGEAARRTVAERARSCGRRSWASARRRRAVARPRRGCVPPPRIALAALGASVGLARRSEGPPEGVNPRHSILVLPFDNLRNDPSRRVDARRQRQHAGAQPVPVERSHGRGPGAAARPPGPPRSGAGEDIGLDMARRLAREAGVWTVVLGDFARAGDSLHLAARVYDVATRYPDQRRPGGRPERRGRPPALRPARRQAARPLRRADRPRRSAWPGPPASRSRRTVPTSPAWTGSTAGTWPARSAT